MFTPVITGQILLALQKKRVPQAGMSQVDIPERRREDVKGGDPPVINSNYKVNDRHFFGDIGEFTISLLN